jgi:uncharacterized damage-inducible protein DinB
MDMKDTLLMYARYTQRADASVFSLLNGLSIQDLNEDRGSYYKSLSGLAGHIVGATFYFHGLFRQPLKKSSTAYEALKATEGLGCPDGPELSEESWDELKGLAAIADQTTIDFVRVATVAELSAQVKIDWYGGKPEAVPLHFLLHQAFVHGIHHRGQISQILDSMGVEHDFSGIDVAFLPAS